MKKPFGGLISMLVIAEERIIILECRSTEITQTEKERGKKVYKYMEKLEHITS